MSESKKKISLICPCFNEEDNIPIFYKRILNLFENKNNILNNYLYEIIIVDDFSTDNSRKLLTQIANSDTKIKIIFNARNYGVYRTAYHGLKYATGDFVVPMLPVDMQDPPEFVENMMQKKIKSNKSIIYGIKKERDEGYIVKNLRHFFYFIVNKLSSSKIPENAGEFQIVDKKIIDKILENYDYYPYIRGKLALITSDSEGLEYKWEKRIKGKTKHNFLNLYDHAMNGLISTGISALRLCMLLGIIISFISFSFVLYQIYEYFFIDKIVFDGIPTIISGFFGLMGIMMLFIGLIGEYIGAIHQQVRKNEILHASKTINID